MGFANCGKGSWPENTRRPRHFTIDELKDLEIGEKKEMQEGCGSRTGNAYNELKKAGFGFPENGEFEYGGWGGNCGVCSFEYGCKCPDGQNVAGYKGTVKRVAYNANYEQCCVLNMDGENTVKTIGNQTCDPKHRRPNQQECTNIYRKNCSGEHIFNDACKKLRNSNSTLYKELARTYCNTPEGARKPECVSWCNAEGNKSECSLLKSTEDCKKYGIPDTECTATAVMDINTECKNLRIESDIGQSMGSFKCTRESIKELRDACLKYNLVGQCSSIGVDLAIANDISKGFADASKEQYNQTLGILNNALGGTILPPTSPPSSTSIMGDFFGEYTTYIVIGLVLICCCSLISSILGVIGLGGKKKVKFDAPTIPTNFDPTGPSFGAPTPTDFGSPIIEAPPAYNQDFIKMSS